ncbi:hypothetical protein [Streptomyces sp. NPDC054838]
MSPEPIPKYIEQGALRRASARYEASQQARQDPRSVARRIKAAAKAAEAPSAKAYIDQLAEDESKLIPSPGTHPISAFWSFGVEHPAVPPNKDGVHFLDQRFIAEEWAHQRNKAKPGVAQTLETTRGGRELDDMFLWEDEVIDALGGASAGFTPGYAKETWQKISKTYAKVAEGRAIVFAQTAHTRSILHREELVALCGNPKVGLDNIHFAYEAPPSWPAQTRAEAGTNAVRAVAQFDDPTLPRYIDPWSYAADEPEVRKNEVDKVLAAGTPNLDAAAVKEPPLQAPPKSVRTPLWQVGFKPTPTASRRGASGPSAGTGAGAAPGLAPRPHATGMDGPA